MMGVQSCETMPLPQLGGETLVFETVHIEVFEEDNTDGDPIMFFDTPCDEHFYTIQNLEEGEYYVTFGAMAEYEGQELAFFQMDMDIEAPAEQDEYVEMWQMGSGSVQASWGFVSGFCVGNGVEKIDIALNSVTGDAEYTQEGIDCVDEILLIEDVPWDTYSLSIQGFDLYGSQTHSGETAEDFEVLPGSQVNAFVTLE
jgi:hypothetical protein